MSITEVLTVKIDRCESVKTVESQGYSIAELCIKARFVYGRAILYPAIIVIVIAVEDVLDYARIDKVGM